MRSIANAETFASAARSHWGVENRLHWVLDVTFREDNCHVRKGHVRKTADSLPDYCASLLGLAPRG